MESTLKNMEHLFKLILEKEVKQEDWRRGKIIILPKEGGLTKCYNRREITLLFVSGKNNVIMNRIKE